MFRASKFYSEMYLKETIRVTHKAIVANDSSITVSLISSQPPPAPD